MNRDIKPVTPVATPRHDFSDEERQQPFPFELVTALVGMNSTYVRRVIGKSGDLNLRAVQLLLDQDAYAETFVPRSKIIDYLLRRQEVAGEQIALDQPHQIIQGNALELITRLPDRSVQSVVTSTPYWGMRLYDTHFEVTWADGEICAFGNEQTPEAFIRHTTELLYVLKPKMELDGSVWWNLMDTYNTRTQIRENAAETLYAMQGLDARGWHDHAARRYSAGHSFLEDGEQCMIPSRVAERASRIGYLIKSQIFWKKDVSMPETVKTRVTREAEHILHLTLQRSPYFDKEAFRTLPRSLGGRNPLKESDKITDIWCLPTAMGQDGHGAQFPLELPGRCVGLTSEPGDLILDPFVGSGSTSVAALELGRCSIGFDISEEYVGIAQLRIQRAQAQQPVLTPLPAAPLPLQPRPARLEEQVQPHLL